ncbi:hypothetical protein DY000_02055488 [Brassica cretica]|uniref:Reverse transcriptase zinc-binding domain-containing protein n=1 Tax=Brassica cretica TaxID=69181 RepID=A0ABQ7ACB0_BRACR|nr:hypothetical protein DY000_02055488 [Brassica cretica]
MEKTMRCLLKGIQVDDRVVPGMAVKSYLLFSIICLSWKLILATFVIFLDKGNRFSDGKRVNRMIGSELGLVNGYKCIVIGYKWTDSGRFIAPLLVYWCHIIRADHGLESLRCDELQLFVFDPIFLMVGFDMVSRVSMIKYRLCFPSQKTVLLWLCHGLIIIHAIVMGLMVDGMMEREGFEVWWLRLSTIQRGVAERALWCYKNVQDGVIITTHFGTAVVGSDVKSSIVEWSFKLLTLRVIFGKGSLLENVFIDMVNCWFDEMGGKYIHPGGSGFLVIIKPKSTGVIGWDVVVKKLL